LTSAKKFAILNTKGIKEGVKQKQKYENQGKKRYSRGISSGSADKIDIFCDI
jgi:hypothetical protein